MPETGLLHFRTSSPGKLMLAGEYFVLQGAPALAFPTMSMQELFAKDGPDGLISWQTYYDSTLIYTNGFSMGDFSPRQKPNHPSTVFIRKLLTAARRLNPGFLDKGGVQIHTRLQFHPGWGWGSSSSLTVNLARFAGVDPFELHQSVSGGSGYDVAVAMRNRPLVYRCLPGMQIDMPEIDYPFSDRLFLLYSGRKQDTAQSLRAGFLTRKFPAGAIHDAGRIVEALARTRILTDFSSLLKEYEHLVSQVSGMPCLQATVYSDFEGTIKPLGAWGGDFVLVVWEGCEADLRDYFAAKGLDTLLRWNDYINCTGPDEMGLTAEGGFH